MRANSELKRSLGCRGWVPQVRKCVAVTRSRTEGDGGDVVLRADFERTLVERPDEHGAEAL